MGVRLSSIDIDVARSLAASGAAFFLRPELQRLIGVTPFAPSMERSQTNEFRFLCGPDLKESALLSKGDGALKYFSCQRDKEIAARWIKKDVPKFQIRLRNRTPDASERG